MLCVQLGNGAYARGVCCVAFGDGVVARGAFKVEFRSTVTFPDTATIEDMDTLINALNDLGLTYQALADDGFAPAEFAVRSKAALSVATDACTRHRTKLVAAAAAAPAPAVASSSKGKEEAVQVVE